MHETGIQDFWCTDSVYLKCIALTIRLCVCVCVKERERLMVRDGDRGREMLHWCVAGGLLQ